MRRLAPLILVLFPLALTWPLAGHLTTHLPLGSETTATVPFLNLWTLGWNADRLLQGWQGYWQAPIFHPTSGAFAFSDPQPLTGPLAALLWSLSPALAYNTTLLLYMSLNGISAYALLRDRGLKPAAALAAGLTVQALPFLTHERGVLQLQPLFGPILAIGALWRLFDGPTLRRAAALGLATGVTFLTSEYYALLLLPAIAAHAAFHLRAALRRRLWLSAGLALAVALAIILPVALPQGRYLQAMGFRRSATSLQRTSAQPIDYLRASPRLRLHSTLPDPGGGSGQRLYPGAGLLVMGLAGAALGLRRAGRRRWTLALTASALAAGVLALGANIQLGSFNPLEALRHYVPGMLWIRSPFRMAVFLQLSLALLAAEVFQRLLAGRRALVAMGLAIAVLGEVWPLPEPLRATPPMDPAWARAVARSGARVVAHIPWAEGEAVSAYQQTSIWMLQALPQDLRLVNGYSGFFPKTNRQLRHLLKSFPSAAGLRALQVMGVEAVVIHRELTDEEISTLEEALAREEIEIILRGRGLWGLSLLRGRSSSASRYRGPWNLQADYERGRLNLGALAVVPDASFYLYDVWSTPLPLEVVVEDGTRRWRRAFRPAGTALLYHGSSARLRQTWDLPLPAGSYLVTLARSDDLKPVASTTLEVEAP